MLSTDVPLGITDRRLTDIIKGANASYPNLIKLELKLGCCYPGPKFTLAGLQTAQSGSPGLRMLRSLHFVAFPVHGGDDVRGTILQFLQTFPNLYLTGLGGTDDDASVLELTVANWAGIACLHRNSCRVLLPLVLQRAATAFPPCLPASVLKDVGRSRACSMGAVYRILTGAVSVSMCGVSF